MVFTMLTREDVIKKIEEMLQGKISSDELMNWTWDQHWNHETGKNKFDDKRGEVIFDTILTLMSMDGGHNSRLSERHFRELLRKLKSKSQ